MRGWRALYTVVLLLVLGGLYFLRFFWPKLRLWWRARQTSPPLVPIDRPVLWMHCASVGEFEQGRPVLEYLLQELPRRPYVVVTFFSPSGWMRYQQSYPFADWMGPAPTDLPWIVRQWIEAIHPTAVFFVKYDLWPNLVGELARVGCPQYLLAAHVAPLRGPRWWWRKKLLRYMDHLFVQTAADQAKLSTEGFTRVTLAGDSRVLRVRQLVENWLPVSGIAEWLGNQFCAVAGSVWEADVRFLAQAYAHLRGQQIRWILVPHEVSPRQIEAMRKLWPVPLSLYTESEWNPSRDTLLVDTTGLLAYLYAHAHVAWIGGGFGKGIHNILEAVAYGKPVFFGPNYHEFPEAEELIKLKVAESCQYPVGFANVVKNFVKNKNRLQKISEKSKHYLSLKPNTPKIVVEILKEKQWMQVLLQPE